MKILTAWSTLTVFVILISNMAIACPNWRGDYCCGISGGDIQRCDSVLHIDQKAISGGVAYVLSGNGPSTGEILVDGKGHPYRDETMNGDYTASCSDSYVGLKVNNVVVQNRPLQGSYSQWIRLMDKTTDLAFGCRGNLSDHGVPVATGCVYEVYCSPKKAALN